MDTRSVDTGRITLELTERGSGPLVVLLHGFPESCHSWRHQLAALSDAGYRAVAPNQRGYGDSDRPPRIEDYDVIELAADVDALITTLGEEHAVVVGHDWGSPVAYHTALLHPARVSKLVTMSVPFGGRPFTSPLETMQRKLSGMFFYMLYFQEPGVAEAELEQDVALSLSKIFYALSGDAKPEHMHIPQPPGGRWLDTLGGPEPVPWLTEADLAHSVATFKRSGFRGPINWYRNFTRSWERTAALADKTIDQPTLFISGDRDPVSVFSRHVAERMSTCVPNLTRLELPGCGHWTQQERPNEVNRALLEFLGR